MYFFQKFLLIYFFPGYYFQTHSPTIPSYQFSLLNSFPPTSKYQCLPKVLSLAIHSCYICFSKEIMQPNHIICNLCTDSLKIYLCTLDLYFRHTWTYYKYPPGASNIAYPKSNPYLQSKPILTPVFHILYTVIYFFPSQALRFIIDSSLPFNIHI